MDQPHGGDIDAARARFGGDGWIDLSTGINRLPWPVPEMGAEVWQPLPTATAQSRVLQAAQTAYRTDWPGVVLAGAQAAIDLLPRLTRAGGTARILTPTYSEHEQAFARADRQVEPVSTLDALNGAEVAVVVTPNNPGGQIWPIETLLALAGNVDMLILDESFIDPTPQASALTGALPGNVLVLRSLGKFYGLAGARVGFAFGADRWVKALRAEAGPWPVAGPSLAVAELALEDHDWAQATRTRLAKDAPRLDALATAAGWAALGGTPLFRLYETGDAVAAQAALAQHAIWSRRFDYAPGWLRLGLPGSAAEWERLQDSLAFGFSPNRPKGS